MGGGWDILQKGPMIGEFFFFQGNQPKFTKGWPQGVVFYETPISCTRKLGLLLALISGGVFFLKKTSDKRAMTRAPSQWHHPNYQLVFRVFRSIGRISTRGQLRKKRR